MANSKIEFSGSKPTESRSTQVGYRALNPDSTECDKLLPGFECDGRFYPIVGWVALDENDVYGTIGRSGGTIRIPLICPPRSSSGSGLLDGSIVRIDDVIARKTLWAHRKFHLPETVLQAISPPMETDGQRYVVEALVEGKTHARFGSWDEAGHCLAMQSGRCLDNPGTDD